MPINQPETILLDHGSGGLASQELISSLFLKYLTSPLLAELEDASLFSVPAGQLAMTTDSYVVDPLFFPGGDIGMLAVHGTLNDLAMRGAQTLHLSLAFILEEGLSLELLEQVLISIRRCCEQAKVAVITGDTKVVPKGKADRLFINTSGIGLVPHGRQVALHQARPGDKIIVSGTMADHGLTIMAQRAGLALEGDLQSDTAALHTLADALCDRFGPAIHSLRDPTRGGLATTLSEISKQTGTTLTVDQEKIPLRPAVQAGCELLGLEPLYLANEGKLVAVVAAQQAEEILAAMHQYELGQQAAIIGEITDQAKPRVVLQTAIGGARLLTPLQGQPLPRIC